MKISFFTQTKHRDIHQDMGLDIFVCGSMVNEKNNGYYELFVSCLCHMYTLLRLIHAAFHTRVDCCRAAAHPIHFMLDFSEKTSTLMAMRKQNDFVPQNDHHASFSKEKKFSNLTWNQSKSIMKLKSWSIFFLFHSLSLMKNEKGTGKVYHYLLSSMSENFSLSTK